MAGTHKGKIAKGPQKSYAACLKVVTSLVLHPAGSPVPAEGLMLYKVVSNKQVTERANISHCYLEVSLIYSRTPNLQNPPTSKKYINFLREVTSFDWLATTPLGPSSSSST